MIVTILCGGNGTRLFPISREKLPKQFHRMTNEYTMFQNTLRRFSNIEISKFLIICNKEHCFIVEQQIEELGLQTQYQIIAEPEGRDTSSAIAVAALSSPSPHMLIVPCDHVYDDEHFCTTIQEGKRYLPHSIVTFGIKPTYPETGYGYIKTNHKNNTVRFEEKPNLELARKYLESDDYYWNAGVFMFETQHLLSCFSIHAPEVLKWSMLALEHSTTQKHTIHLNADYFAKSPKISFDYAIMEKITAVDGAAFTVSYDGKWTDIGSFKALHDECPKSEDGNVVHQGQAITIDSTNCFISTEDDTIVATVGIKDLVIVNTKDVLLISHQDSCQKIKDVVKRAPAHLKEIHTKAFRPWGWYMSVDGGDHSGYKVKRICVYPGKRLSLQSHEQRSEHWVIAKGNARVQLNDTFINMKPNDHIYIPIGALHRMENQSDENVEFIETQIGVYLGEDDIIRYQDDFGRT